MAGVRISSGSSLLDQLGGSIIPGSTEHGFLLRVLVAGPRVTPRHSMFEYYLDMGREYIPKIVNHKSLGTRKGDKLNLLFVLPERWMSVHEQQMFTYRLKTHPEKDRIGAVDIITQEALIVGGLTKDELGMFDLKEGDREAGLKQQDIAV